MCRCGTNNPLQYSRLIIAVETDAFFWKTAMHHGIHVCCVIFLTNEELQPTLNCYT